jgi:uncharacterized protein (DUF488 family)
MASMVATVGYEGLAPAAFLDHLAAARVAVVVDVRAIAASRRPGFAKRALTSNLASAGIDYVHLPALGTPKAGRDANKAGRMAEFRRIYAERFAAPEAQFALAALGALAASRPVCLLCVEAEPRQCHRAIIADALAARFGLGVTHLRAY